MSPINFIKASPCIYKSEPLHLKNEVIVNLGVKPSSENFNFGHMKMGDSSACVSKVEKFLEKPTDDQFKEHFGCFNYLWNTGIYVAAPHVFLGEMAICQPDSLAKCRDALHDAEIVDNKVYLPEKLFTEIDTLAIDYALMCKTQKLYTKELKSDWSDLGNWPSVFNCLSQDETQSRTFGKSTSCCSKNLSILSAGPHVVAIGVEDLIIIASQDAILITKEGYETELKKLVTNKQREHAQEFCESPEHYRPWGHFKIIHKGEGFQVKELTIIPGGALSLQKHQHRDERWSVIKGEGVIQIDDSVQVIKPPGTVFVERNVVHRISNQSTQDLVILEIQYGDLILESDIVRLNDEYNRIM